MTIAGLQLRRIGAVLVLTLLWTSHDLAAQEASTGGGESAFGLPSAPAVAPGGDTSRAPNAAETAVNADAAPLSLGSGTEGSYPFIMLRLGLGLGLVVFLAWGTLYLLRRTRLGRQYGVDGSAAMRMLDRLYLGPRKQICLVRIGDRTVAVGVCEQQITALAEWGPGELSLPPEETRESFAGQLRRLMGTGSESPARGEGGGP